MVSLYVGITDFDWFKFLSGQPSLDEVNFWQPGGRTNFRALQPGELFLFKLHSPRNFIVGGGVFARADILPLSITWDAFGTRNGTLTLQEMRRRIAFYRKEPDDPRQDYLIGCRFLTQPFSRRSLDPASNPLKPLHFAADGSALLAALPVLALASTKRQACSPKRRGATE
jgi:putative restriction endonuclease